MKRFPVVLFIALFFPAFLSAMTIYEEEIACPIDGTVFKFHGMGSAFVLKVMLDGRSEGLVMSPPPVPECPDDGFIVYKDFSEYELNILKPYITSQEYQNYRKTESSYWLINKLEEKLLVPAGARIPIMQRATWQNSRYARQTIALISKLTYPSVYELFLKGELYRRTGEFDKALEIFKDLENNHSLDALTMARVKQEIALINDKDFRDTEAVYIKEEPNDRKTTKKKKRK